MYELDVLKHSEVTELVIGILAMSLARMWEEKHDI